jgi:hypothetical protein
MLLLAPGCTAMTVSVSILDPTVLKGTGPWIEADVKAREPAAIKVAGNKDDSEATSRAAYAFFLSLEPEIKKYSNTLIQAKLPEDSAKTMADYETRIRGDYQKAAASYRKGLDESALAKTLGGNPRVEEFTRALNDFREGDRTLLELRQQIMGDLNFAATKISASTQPNSDKNSATSTVADASQQVTAKFDDLVGNAGILDDPHAPLVINAPESAWKGEPNNTRGCTILGNGDIAIKMQSIGNFNLKGIRVDATKVTQATFNALNLGVKLVAAAYGIPLPAGTGSSSTAAATTTAQTSQTDTDAASKQYQAHAAAVAILQAIASQADNAQKDAAGAETARQQVLAIYNSYKDQLGPASTP